jgi:hypothetical protein
MAALACGAVAGFSGSAALMAGALAGLEVQPPATDRTQALIRAPNHHLIPVHLHAYGQ